MPPRLYSPGHLVPYSAVYNVVDENDQITGRQEQLEKGATFPSMRGGKERRYKLEQLVNSPKRSKRRWPWAQAKRGPHT